MVETSFSYGQPRFLLTSGVVTWSNSGLENLKFQSGNSYLWLPSSCVSTSVRCNANASMGTCSQWRCYRILLFADIQCVIVQPARFTIFVLAVSMLTVANWNQTKKVQLRLMWTVKCKCNWLISSVRQAASSLQRLQPGYKVQSGIVRKDGPGLAG